MYSSHESKQDYNHCPHRNCNHLSYYHNIIIKSDYMIGGCNCDGGNGCNRTGGNVLGDCAGI